MCIEFNEVLSMKKRVPIKKLLPIYAVVLISCLCVAHFGSGAVTVMVENAPIEGRTCIIVDAGHGGIDGGATSCSGVLESQINLEIALRLNDLLQFLGYETVMIRTTDTSIYTEGNTIAAQKVSDLKQRVKLVNETENGILISIHQNTFPDGRYSGAQVFYANDDSSKALAKQMQSVFKETLNPGSKRQCKPSDGIYLMQNITRPGVLIECGFLTNPEEEARLRDGVYQKNLVCVIASGVSQYCAVPLPQS
jgi:N-acetylmuramoyl-L-alanine amidase